MPSVTPKERDTALARAGGWRRSFRSANPPQAPRRFGPSGGPCRFPSRLAETTMRRSACCAVQPHRPPLHIGDFAIIGSHIAFAQ